MAQPQAFPPRPPGPELPRPPSPEEVFTIVDQQRDTIEAQQRHIRYLLDNYNQLLAEVGGPPAIDPTPRSFNPNDVIPKGTWVARSASTVTHSWGTQTVTPGVLIHSDGTAHATNAMQAHQIAR